MLVTPCNHGDPPHASGDMYKKLRRRRSAHTCPPPRSKTHCRTSRAIANRPTTNHDSQNRRFAISKLLMSNGPKVRKVSSRVVSWIPDGIGIAAQPRNPAPPTNPPRRRREGVPGVVNSGRLAQ